MKQIEKLGLYRLACDLWGVKAQLVLVIEECAELIVALSKRTRTRNGSKPIEIVSEGVDVEIMIEQLKHIYNFMYPSINWDSIKLSKLEDLSRRLKEAI